MCTPYLRAISIKIKIFSSRTMRITENSSDLSSGRRPVSKSDEFLVILIVLPEIMRCEHDTFPIHGHTYWDFESEHIAIDYVLQNAALPTIICSETMLCIKSTDVIRL